MDNDPMKELRVDPERVKSKLDSDLASGTGIYVRAIDVDGRWKSVDIEELTRDSLLTWLRSRGGENPWAESVVLVLLGHEPIASAAPVVVQVCE